MDDHRTKGPTEGFRDDQGTRVGAPDQSAPRQHSDAPSGRPERQTGAGSEAAEGVHNARDGAQRGEGDATGLAGQETGRSAREGSSGRAGSEPLPEEGKQHRSGYGGAGGRPVTSSDQREGPRRQ